MTVALPSSPSVYQTRQGLVDYVIDLLDGQVTDDQVKFFINLAEARFNRIIISPEREQRATTPITTNISLPNDCWALRSIKINTNPVSVLEQMSPSALDKRFADGVAGVPVAFALINNAIIFGPQPDDEYSLTITYQATIPALSDTNTNNWLLVSHPDVYLYATLVQAEAFIANDERIGLWKSGLDEALSELIESSSRRRAFASPIRLRANVVV